MRSEAADWFELFRTFGRAPSPDSYAAVFHPEGEVADAGAAPVPASQVREAIAHVLRLMPDLFIDMKRYRARGRTPETARTSRRRLRSWHADCGGIPMSTITSCVMRIR